MSGDDGSAGEVPDEIAIPIEDELDLHPFRPREIRSVVESYLNEAVERGFSEVRLVHGKGIGVQRANVRAALQRHPAVVSFRDGGPGGGEWGATVVHLRAPAGRRPGPRGAD